MAQLHSGYSETVSYEMLALPPFSLERTVAALRRRPTNLVEIYEDGEYRRMLTIRGAPRLLAVRQSGPDRVRLRALDGPLALADEVTAAALLDRILGLHFDLAPVQRAVSADERLALLMAQVPGLKPPAYESLWTTLLCVVPFQQVSLEAGQSILNRVVMAFGTTREHAGRAYYAYPTAEELAAADPEALRRCGLSQAKVRTLLGAAERIASGILREGDIEGLDDVEAVRRLTELPGIGPWSAQVILLRGFRRLSVFPAGDSGASGSLARVFQIRAAEVEERSGRLTAAMGPWKGYLYFLLLASRLLQAGILVADNP